MKETIILKKIILQCALDPEERARVLARFSQIEGNAEFVAFYPSKIAFDSTIKKIDEFKPISGIMRVWINTDRGGNAAVIYCLAKVEHDEFFSLTNLMRLYAKGNVTSVWLGIP